MNVEIGQPREPPQRADIHDRVVVAAKNRQLRELAQYADVADRVVRQVEIR